MTVIRFIGDVHGKYGPYKKILKNSPCTTVQVGDMGVGFKNFNEEMIANPPYNHMVDNQAKFIRGNHDNPATCRKHSQWIPDGHKETTENSNNIMYVGGAFSIDAHHRFEGYNWWCDEQLSMNDLDKIVVDYMTFCPDVMVTHDCPQSVAFELFLKGTKKEVIKTRTGQAFEAMLSLHKPKLWIFGHWHESKNVLVNGTRFICLAELETIDIEV